MSQPQSQDDLQAVVNVLLSQLKQQGKGTKLPATQTWVERHLAAPKSFPEILWRICWLLIVPAIAFRLWLPLSDWCWFNGYPIVTISVWVGVLGLYWLTYHFAVNTPTSNKMQRLVDIQFALPLAVVWFLLCWEVLSSGR